MELVRLLPLRRILRAGEVSGRWDYIPEWRLE